MDSTAEQAGVTVKLQLDLASPGAGVGVFDAWEMVGEATPDAEEATRPAALQEAPQVVIWENRLPGRLPVAQARLERRLYRLEQAQRAMPWAEQRLGYFAERAPGLQQPGGSYAIGDIWSQAPEAALQSLLWEQQAAGVQFAAGALDYASLGEIGQKIKSAYQRVERLVQRVNLLLAPTAWVYTRPGGRLLAATSVDWLGHQRTYCAPGSGGEILALHRAEFGAFLVDRQVWMRIAMLSFANALKLAVRLPGGLGVVAAIPGIIDFIEQVVDQFRQLEEGTREEQ